MGIIRLPRNVLLLTAVCSNDRKLADLAVEKMIALYGPLKASTEPFPFNHTRYYQDEMGQQLEKYYITFANLIDPAAIVDIKITTNSIEEEFSASGARNVNLDPGYIEVPKLVLATTKNFSHRIYMDKGIYGDVQLYWQNGSFHPNPWTYPDYNVPDNLSFFNKQRQEYFKSIQEELP